MLSQFAHLILRLSGWSLHPYTPTEPKYLLIAAPHTALIDGIWMVISGIAFGIRPSFLVKQTYVKGLRGRIIVALGGIPVMSGAKANMVQASIDMIKSAERIALLMAPAGTRSKEKHWRSGFFHIGKGADIPIYFSYLDYGERRIGVHPEPLRLSGNITQDMDHVRAFYGEMAGKFREKQSRIALKEEKIQA